MRTKIKIEYWYKRIPNQYQEQLGGLGKFKISLSRIKKRTAKEKEIVKSMLNLKVSNIFNNIRDYDLEKAKEYLKTIINLMILELDNVEEISEQKINDKINVLTISKLMEGEKANREKEYKINNSTFAHKT